MTSTAEYKDLEAKYYMQVVRRMPPVLFKPIVDQHPRLAPLDHSAVQIIGRGKTHLWRDINPLKLGDFPTSAGQANLWRMGAAFGLIVIPCDKELDWRDLGRGREIHRDIVVGLQLYLDFR